VLWEEQQHTTSRTHQLMGNVVVLEESLDNDITKI
jgi:hypothetical protein